MSLLILASGILLISGVAAIFFQRFPRWSSAIAAGGAVVGCGMGLIPSLLVLFGHPAESLKISWPVPYGSLSLELDALSAFFLLPVFGFSALAAVYGNEYLAPWHGKKSVGVSWFFFNLLIISMSLVVLARNGVLFLFAWEIMSLSSFFLVTFEHEKKNVRDAGWIYLVATQAGTACLLALFILLGKETGSLDFDRWKAGSGLIHPASGVLFFLALIGFGTKAGFVPFHIWLPEAHPAAPSHVSAVMSGVMIKIGLYGLIRYFTFFPNPPIWWAAVLIGTGAVSGLLGILFALSEHDLKRLLAYSSVENMGIITMGLGMGLLGISTHSPALAVLGFGGSLLHVLNHAMFKGLLFFGAGAVLHGTGIGQLDLLGGLLKKMRWTGTTFLIGAAALSGLPLLNGFVSEFLLYLAALKGIFNLESIPVLLILAALVALILIGGLAMACFTKVFGVVFLGHPRSEAAAHAHEVGWGMRFSMICLALGCVFFSFAGPYLMLHCMGPILETINPWLAVNAQSTLAEATVTLLRIILASSGFFLIVTVLTEFRRWLLAGRTISLQDTWACGYAQSSSRMQVTASSFTRPLASMFRIVLRTKRRFLPANQGLFPVQSSLTTQTPDVFTENLFRPFYRVLRSSLAKLRWLQHGRLQLYVLYIGMTLLILLIWNLR